MPTIEFRSSADLPFARVTATDLQTRLAQVPREELERSQVRSFHAGSDTAPQLFEVRLDPGTVVPPHAHSVDEIVVIVMGEMTFGRRRCRPGDTVFIPARTLYSFTSGPDGVQFLNFRSSADHTYLTKEEVAAQHSAVKAPRDA